MCGVWSATPTPFTEKLEIDIPSVKRMVEHQVRLGIKGLFLAGTCGEGPWMPDGDRRILTRAVVKYNRGRVLIAVQVTDNSAARILDNAAAAAEDGADIAVIAPPFFHGNPAPDVLLRLYRQAIRESPLPVGVYDRGRFSSVAIPNSVLKQIYAESKVVLVKDSSMQPDHMRIALAARRKRPRLRLLNGYEFGCVPYLTAGYDGLLLGGAIFHGHLARQMMDAVAAGHIERADQIQQRMNRMMYAVFDGRKLKCWLSGQKRLLVEMGIFSTWRSYLEYPLTDRCIRAIKRVVKREADVLFP
jgi:4-hydroxy-tetrahydrodipicolinate synthase